jgi:hypothetical protein
MTVIDLATTLQVSEDGKDLEPYRAPVGMTNGDFL